MNTTNGRWRFPAGTIPIFLLICLTQAVPAQSPPDPWPPLPTQLDSWSFNDNTNWTDDNGQPPISFANIAWSNLGNGSSLVVETNVPAWVNYPIYATSGATNIVVNGPGSICFWYGGGWSTTNGGPGEWAQLIDCGQWSSNSSIGYFGLSIDPWGSNVWFFSQDGLGNSYSLSAPISWTTNYFHLVTLTYSQTNVSLYLDGQLATNDPGGLAIWPAPAAVASGVYFGSDTNGNFLANGLFDWVKTFGTVLDSNTVAEIYNQEFMDYEIMPWNIPYMALSSASSMQAGNSYSFTNYIIPDVITGPGFLQSDGVAAGCSYSTSPYNVWITNVTATVSGTGTNAAVNLIFSIDGGRSGYMYDVFATSALEIPITNAVWAWMGQGLACQTYTLTITNSPAAFLILGTPQDSDFDGLTDAYELLVSHSNPNSYSTDGTQMADGWEMLYFGHIGVPPNGDPDGDGLTTYQEWEMRSQGYNPANWNSFTNSAAGDGYQDYSGDGLANLMEASFGGNMFSNNPSWQVNTSGDGFPDEYKGMVGLPNTTVPAPSLPAYSMNPIQ
jgi:hypothetical protein